jgi:two-component system sensor histidine kinase HydH
VNAALPRTNILDELTGYIGFDGRDARALSRIGPLLAPSFPGIVDAFYGAIERHPRAHASFTGGAPQIAHQKERLCMWLADLFSGRYDADYYERRARIGRAHVGIELEQRYMFGAMSIVRAKLHDALTALALEDAHECHRAIDRICDLELAMMLETYRERFVERERAQERLATIGQVAASIGHELRNPLAVIASSLYVLRRRVDDPNATRHFDRIGKQIALSSSIVSGLLALARDRPPERLPVSLHALAAEAIELAPSSRAVIKLAIDPALPRVEVDPDQMRQVLINLVQNAAQAIEGGGGDGEIEIAAGLLGTYTWIEVRDDGPGFSAEVRGRAFEPLVTSKATGVGLGLALCARIVEAHDGTLEAHDRPGGGAVIRISLPRGAP